MQIAHTAAANALPATPLPPTQRATFARDVIRTQPPRAVADELMLAYDHDADGAIELNGPGVEHLRIASRRTEPGGAVKIRTYSVERFAAAADGDLDLRVTRDEVLGMLLRYERRDGTGRPFVDTTRMGRDLLLEIWADHDA